ncbi:cytochrome P450 [Aaosphaeria arxii CBS 175.79]|uniref:Cytochrome P450 n=1 Tax=Aaosphaeria arxii CBS 175.79 TaxID=1450172 RepID=A0A6A5XR06_9PLEO|nr:cytochrome P450 [Aaosphaeria arxii CBS 175.79]KAF2015191.1 cytochrome P450 [Aaosphaeria arxii CBS 175.79]
MNFYLQFVTVPFLSFILLKVLHCMHYNHRKNSSGCRDPPSYPHKDPIWGIDLFILTIQAFSSGEYLDRSTARFIQFKSKTWKSHSFGTTVYHTIDPEVAKNYQSIYFKSFGIEPIRYHLAENLWGNGIVVTDGEKWSAVRSFIRSSFDIVHTANIERLAFHVEKFMELLPRDGTTFDLMPLFKRLVLDTSSEFIFGRSLMALEHPDVAFMESFEYAQRGTGIRMMLGRLKFLHRDAQWLQSCKQVTDFCEARVEEAIERVKDGSERRTEKNRLRLVDEAVKATTDRYTLRSLILSVFSPAHDGAAIALSNVFFHLARHPKVWHKLREEDVILPCGGGSTGSERLFVKKGDIIESDYRAMMRDPDLWGTNAEEFFPERWEVIRPTWEYLPFGGGPRHCPGIRLVFVEAAYTTVRILQEFKLLENRDNEVEWKEKMRMSFQSKNGTLVGLVPV